MILESLRRLVGSSETWAFFDGMNLNNIIGSLLFVSFECGPIFPSKCACFVDIL